MTAAREHILADLRDQIASLGGGNTRKGGVLPFKVAEIDAALPGGGLAHGALHEIAGGGSGTLDGAAAALFAAGVAARAKGKVLWCLSRPESYCTNICRDRCRLGGEMAKAFTTVGASRAD